MNTIVSQNLELMLSLEKGGMDYCINFDTVYFDTNPENKGIFYSYPQFYFNPKTGQILYFESLRESLESKKETNPTHQFNLAVILKDIPTQNIFKFIQPDNTTKEAKTNLKATVEEYNRIQNQKSIELIN
jgi:hypothetical protein